MNYCKSCGSPVTGQFCTRCGASVGAVTPSTGQPAAGAGNVPGSGGPTDVSVAGAPPASSRTNPIVWILLGCGGLVVIAAILAMTTGLFFAHKIRQAGVQIKSHGDGSDGSFEIRSKDGSLRFGGGRAKIPAWLPVYPGSNPQSAFSAESDKGDAGSYHFTTRDSVEQVLDFYEGALKKAGFDATRNTIASGSGTMGTISASRDSDNRGAVVTATVESDGTQVNVVFHRKR